MKANELMIGDCVIANFGQNIRTKVHSLTSKKIGFHIKDKETRLYHCQLCQVKPIPLTEEILMANGYVRLSEDYYEPPFGEWEREEWIDFGYTWVFEGEQLNNIKKSLCVRLTEIHKNEFIFSNLFGKCNYVHEIQHALRLCGLKELADNFKIE